jgi:hypothetical protein
LLLQGEQFSPSSKDPGLHTQLWLSNVRTLVQVRQPNREHVKHFCGHSLQLEPSSNFPGKHSQIGNLILPSAQDVQFDALNSQLLHQASHALQSELNPSSKNFGLQTQAGAATRLFPAQVEQLSTSPAH